MQQTIQLGQVQPSVLSQVKAVVKNWRAKFDQAIMQSEFCQVLGITPWHFTLQGVAVTLLLFLVLVVVCGVAEWLEGGAL
jgi:hypothetical protein